MLYSVVIVFILTLLKLNVAEGYFLASTQERTGTALASASAFDSVLHGPGDSDKGESRLPDRQEAEKYPVIEAIHLRLQRVFGRYTESWWLDWKLWVGLTFWLAVWAKWIIHGHDTIYYQQGLYAFGINIIILHHLQYAQSILTGMMGVCALLTAQSVFQSFHWFKAEPHADDDDDFECDTLYLDLGLPVEQIVVLFVAQFGVWWFYMTSIIGNLDFSNVNYLFWLWAYLVMQMTMIFNRGPDSVLGTSFPCNDVMWIIQVSDKARWHLRAENGEKGDPFQVTKANIIMRGVMGFFCNGILREIMSYTIPLMLMSFSEPMDFVVYCVGVNFICTLDDMSKRDYVMTSMTSVRTSMSEANVAEQAEAKTAEAEVKSVKDAPPSDEPKASTG